MFSDGLAPLMAAVGRNTSGTYTNSLSLLELMGRFDRLFVRAVLEAVVEGLRHGEEYVKRACMFSLGATGEAAVPYLLSMMAEDDFDTATFAVHALADACQTP